MTVKRFHDRLVSVFLMLLWPLTSGAISFSASDDRPRIVAFGDSLTAGLGVQADESYPAQLQRRLDGLGYHYVVINAGVSGDTTAGGLRRVPWILNSKPELVILELGANDLLRGVPPGFESFLTMTGGTASISTAFATRPFP